jgi:hypothetical protein
MLVSALFRQSGCVVLGVLTFQDKYNIHILYCQNINNLFALVAKRGEKLDTGLLFYLFLKLVQINFIYSDNEHILCIYPFLDICFVFNTRRGCRDRDLMVVGFTTTFYAISAYHH